MGGIKIYLSRYEVVPGWDAWTLIPSVLAALALVAAFGYYAYSLYFPLPMRAVAASTGTPSWEIGSD